MKRIFSVVAFFSILLVQHVFAQDSSAARTQPVLNNYYAIKDALVNSNPAAAAASAAGFIKALNVTDDQAVKKDIRIMLLSDAVDISRSHDIQTQREKFTSLSDNMVSLAKLSRLSASPVYQQYCPMKKASWLSSSKAIKNPYYGNAMLTCGSLKETL